uniref:Uncharacterized protein n=1 Tax=Arion vulgaris TaxID=1028688 RepID=A0A0B7BT02_9EUPU
MGVDIGTSRKERHTKFTKRLINEHQTGFLSHWTLLNFLRWRSEHLWKCLEFCDDFPHITDNN